MEFNIAMTTEDSARRAGKGGFTLRSNPKAEPDQRPTVWHSRHDCKLCNLPHPVCVEGPTSPPDGAVYAYSCPTKKKETKFRYKDLAWTTDQKCPKGSIVAKPSKA
jgi:hypothetical protein